MPKLILKVEGSLINEIVGNITSLRPIFCELGQEDFINFNNFTAYLQNFSKIEEVTEIQKPVNFGLVNIKPRIEIDISY